MKKMSILLILFFIGALHGMEDKNAPKGSFLGDNSLLSEMAYLLQLTQEDPGQEVVSTLLPDDAFNAKCRDVDLGKLFGSYMPPAIECGNVSSSNSQYIEQQRKAVQQQIEEKDLIADGLLDEKNNADDTDYLSLILGWQAKEKDIVPDESSVKEISADGAQTQGLSGKRKYDFIALSSSDLSEDDNSISSEPAPKKSSSKYSCPEPDCGEVIPRNRIEVHKAWHAAKGGDFVCDPCQFAFLYHSRLKNHLQSESHRIVMGQMDLLNEKNSVNDTDYLKSIPSQHMSVLRKPAPKKIRSKYICPEPNCGKHIPERHVDAHKAWHAQSRAFLCNACQFAFLHLCGLEDHVKSESHRVVMDQMGLGDEENEETTLDLGEKDNSISSEPAPKKMSIQYICPDCGERVNQRDIEAHKAWHAKSRSFLCDPCKLAFINRNRLENHFKSKNHKIVTGQYE